MMTSTTQFTIHEIVAILRRRKRLLIIPPIVVMMLCTIAAYTLPRKYVSSTTILVQREEVLNPLVRFDMAVSLASEDRTQMFNDILYSRSTIQALIDSLGLGKDAVTESEKQEQINGLRGSIQTDRPGSSSFRVIFTADRPARAQHGAAFLAHHFIQTVLRVENQRSEQTVQFFESKLDEFRQKFKASQREFLPLLQQRIADMPLESGTLVTQIEETTQKVHELDARIKTYQQALAVLQTFPEAMRTPAGKQTLFELQRDDLPFAADLRPLLTKYDDYTKRYTEKYPEVITLEGQILDVLDRMRNAVESDIPKQRRQQWEFEKQQGRLIGDLQRSSVSQQIDQDKESNYNIYRSLYDDMKVKLEQAQTNRELRNRGQDEFLIIDPPIMPIRPTRPNRKMIVFGGAALGMLLGVLAVIAAELLDTTIRTPRDLEVYQKRVIAFIPHKTALLQNRASQA